MRRRRLLVVIAVLSLGLAGVFGAAWSEWYAHRDFSSLYHGARLVGRIDVYDQVAWCREARGTVFGAIDPAGREACPAVFLYPLWTAVVLLPLGLLPLEAAASLWCAFSIAAVVLGARYCWLAVRGPSRTAPLFVALVFGSQPVWLMLAAGQLGGVLLLAAGAAAWLLSRGREGAAGATLVMLAIKPHVLGLAAAGLVARALATRSRPFLLGALGGTAGLLLVSLPFLPSWPIEWARESFTRQTGYAPSLATAWGMAAHDMGSVAYASLLIVLVTVVSVALAHGIPRDGVAFMALAIPLSLFATPYAWSYDFIVLALPWAFVLARAHGAHDAIRRVLTAALVLVASLLPWSLYMLAFARGAETLSALIPAMTALLVGATLHLTSQHGLARAA